MIFAIQTTGLHPATASCMEALQWLHERRACARVLDMGCGSGILSVMAAGLWNADVLAVDISPDAIADATAQIAAHNMQHQITALRSDGFSESMIRTRAPYDLIIFNMLAEPIVHMAPLVQSHLAGGGVCILSGVLSWLANEVEQTYKTLGFTTLKMLPHSPWVTYVMEV